MDPHGFFQPTFYRLLNYRPPITMDPDGRFAKSCTDILRACGDSTISFDEILDVLAKAGSSIIQILHSILNDAKYLTYNDVSVPRISMALLIPAYCRSRRLSTFSSCWVKLHGYFNHSPVTLATLFLMPLRLHRKLSH